MKTEIRDLRDLLPLLRLIHKQNRINFYEANGRLTRFADQIEKHQEEVGELIKAVNGKNDEPPECEVWDCVISILVSMLDQCDDQLLLDGLDSVILKLMGRTKVTPG